MNNPEDPLIKTALVVVAACLVAVPALAGGKFPLRSDTDIQANSTEIVPHTGTGERYSNWPALPERQAGRSYSQLVHTTSGVRERNFESGR